MASAPVTPWLILALVAVSVTFISLYATKTCESVICPEPPAPPSYLTVNITLAEVNRNETYTSELIPGTQRVIVTFPGVQVSAFNPFYGLYATMTSAIPGDVVFNCGAVVTIYNSSSETFTDLASESWWSTTATLLGNNAFNGGTTTRSFEANYTSGGNDTILTSLSTFSFVFHNPLDQGTNTMALFWELSD